MHECLLCKKDMKKTKTVFGSGCILNVYKLLNCDLPKKVKNRESYLYKCIMKQTNMKNLNADQKVWLVDRYLTYQYLDKLKYGDYNQIKSELKEDISRIGNTSGFSMLVTATKIKLKEAYSLYKREQKFNLNLNKLKSSKDKDLFTKILTGGFSYIFNISKNSNQFYMDSSRAMQYAFWQVIIECGKIANYDISSDLLQRSLGKKTSDVLITDGLIIDEIERDQYFQKKIKEIVIKYGNKHDEFTNDDKIDQSIVFKDKDLYYAIHGASIKVKGKKENDKWNLTIYLFDRYDYTEFKDIVKYYKDANSVPKSMFSSLIYNLAHISVEYGVIKEYNINIKFEINDYEVN
ncbi:MAG: hypothetical protein IKE01_01890 [Clostridia bacterium]|nr:hypothetical protein [Clostridia bacterium]